MNLKTLLLAGGLACLWSACSKQAIEVKVEDGEKTTATPASEYFQLKVGNYWVYETYQRDVMTGETQTLPKRDRLQVTKDSVITGRSYHVLEGSQLGASLHLLLRLSGPEVIDTDDRLYFATNRPGQVFSLSKSLLAEGVSSSEAMIEEEAEVAVPTGVYATLVLHQEIQLTPDFGGDGAASVDRIDRAYYAKGTGLVKYTQYYPEQGIERGMQLVDMRTD